MAGAEAEARRRGCALVQFRAYDLLAPGLYERLGYETVGVIEGCPAGKRRPLVPQGPVTKVVQSRDRLRASVDLITAQMARTPACPSFPFGGLCFRSSS